MEAHLSAEISLLGMACDLIGGLYLAYDLLGGTKGPLSTLTRVVNYCLMMFLCFLFPLGIKFALIASIGLGTAFGLHVERVCRQQKETLLFLAGVGIVRALAVALAIWLEGMHTVAIIAAPIIFIASIILPKFNISPAAIFQNHGRPQLQKKQLIISAVLGGLTLFASLLGFGITGGAQNTLNFALHFAVTFAFTTLLVTTLSPIVEWHADNMPERRMGIIGIALFMLGFVIQAIPSLAQIYDLQ